MTKKELILVFILTALLATSLVGEYYALKQDSVETFVPSARELKKLWGFNWASALDVENVSQRATKYQGDNVSIVELTYNLFPWTSECKIHAWLYWRSDLSDKSPGVLLVHGIGGSHEMFEKEIPLALLLAVHGYVVLSIDAAGHGKSCIQGSKDWVEASRKIDNITQNLFYQVYVSAVRGIEVLKRIPLVDANRIGVAGVSMGGMTSIVVGSIHPDVKASIPIVASGCIPCMFRSGGLANLIGDPNRGMDSGLLHSISLIDPLTYAGTSYSGKKFLFLFSTHDEYFTMEGLVSTVTTLRGRGDNVAVFIAPNNDHYQVYPGWTESIIAFLDKYLADQEEWNVPEIEVSYSPLVAGYPLAVSVAARPAVPGTMFLVSSPPYVVVPLPLETIGIGLEGGLTHTSLPAFVGYNEGLVVAALSAIALAYLTTLARRQRVYKVVAALALIASILVFIAPYASWKDRFTVTYPELYERYGVLLSSKLGVNMLAWNTLLLVLGPAALFAAIIYGRRLGLVVSWIYAVLQVAPLLMLRSLFAALGERVGYALPVSFTPLEALPLGVAVGVTALYILEFLKNRRARIAQKLVEEEEVEAKTTSSEEGVEELE